MFDTVEKKKHKGLGTVGALIAIAFMIIMGRGISKEESKPVDTKPDKSDLLWDASRQLEAAWRMTIDRTISMHPADTVLVIDLQYIDDNEYVREQQRQGVLNIIMAGPSRFCQMGFTGVQFNTGSISRTDVYSLGCSTVSKKKRITHRNSKL